MIEIYCRQSHPRHLNTPSPLCVVPHILSKELLQLYSLPKLNFHPFKETKVWRTLKDIQMPDIDFHP